MSKDFQYFSADSVFDGSDRNRRPIEIKVAPIPRMPQEMSYVRPIVIPLFSDVMAYVNSQEIQKQPVSSKLWSIASAISEAIDRGMKESTIDWNQVNSSIINGANEFDFNQFGIMNSVGALWKVAIDARMAGDRGPYKVCVCLACKKEFVLTKSELLFYKSKGFQPPKRCKKCRVAKKAMYSGKDFEKKSE